MTNEPLLRFLLSPGRMSPAQAHDVAAVFRPRRILRQELLLAAGHLSDEYFVVGTGLLRAYALNPDGLDVTTGFFGPGQVAFDVASFFQRTPSQETIQALTDCDGWSISHAQLNELFHQRQEFREFGRAVLVRGYAALKSRMLSLITEPAASRYEQLLATNPEILRHAPLRTIASYLGITDTSLSRIRRAGSGA